MPIHSSSIHHTKHSQPEWARGDFFEDDADNDESNNIYNNDLNPPSDNYFGAEHVVLLFDCNPSMFERYIPMMPDEDDVDSDEDMDTLLGIGGGGGSTTENSSIDQVLKIQECLPSKSKRKKQRDLGKEFNTVEVVEGEEEMDGMMDSCPLRQALHDANKAFMKAKKLPDSKAVWIFTNQDDPCKGNIREMSQLASMGHEYQENGIDLFLLPLPKNMKFDKDVFYKTIIDTMTQSDGAVDIEVVLDFFDRAIRKVRKYSSLPLLLPGWKDRENDPGIMLDLFSMVQVKTKPQAVIVHQEMNRATTKVTKTVDKVDSIEIPPERLYTYAEFCGSRVSMKNVDVTKMKSLCNSVRAPSLLILGFKRMSTLSPINLVSKPLLAASNDYLIPGSGKALFNLKQSMLRKDVYAVGELCLKSSAASKMIALVPQNDSRGGFLVLHIPFKDDTRGVASDDYGFVDRNAVDAAKSLVSKTAITNPENIASILPENPLLRHFYTFLESVTLGNELQKPQDDARMDVAGMLEQARDEIENFSLSLPEDDQPVKKAVKRKTSASSGSFKRANAVPERIPNKWIEMYRDDAVENCTANELKEGLRDIGER
ncbi:ATP dependent DNA ligase 1 [Thalassiosira pseudonana CCMP1335]